MLTETPSLLGILGRYAAAIRAVNRQLRAERAIVDMPDHLLKDIGWPDRDQVGRTDARSRHRR